MRGAYALAAVVMALFLGSCGANGRSGKTGSTATAVRKSASDFEIRITDQGEGFEAERVPDPLDETNILRHSGRGLFLMGAFMDDVKVQKVSPSGTEVTLTKKLATAQ